MLLGSDVLSASRRMRVTFSAVFVLLSRAVFIVTGQCRQKLGFRRIGFRVPSIRASVAAHSKPFQMLLVAAVASALTDTVLPMAPIVAT